MIPGAYKRVVAELEAQTQKMNALNVALDYHRDDKVWYGIVFAEFGVASKLVVALDTVKRKMEEAGER